MGTRAVEAMQMQEEFHFLRLSMQIYFIAGVIFATSLAFTLFKMGSTSSNTKSGMSGAGESSYPIVAEENIMAPKAHGTTHKPVMKNLRWNVNYDTADRISSFNRHYAEQSGYWETTDFLNQVRLLT